jgi:hypothetical protein
LKLLASAALFPLFSCKKSELRFPESGGGPESLAQQKMLAKGWGRVAETRVPRGYIVFAVEKKADRISLRDDLFEASRADAVGVF